jgi:hypothetical protein
MRVVFKYSKTGTSTVFLWVCSYHLEAGNFSVVIDAEVIMISEHIGVARPVINSVRLTTRRNDPKMYKPSKSVDPYLLYLTL